MHYHLKILIEFVFFKIKTNNLARYLLYLRNIVYLLIKSLNYTILGYFKQSTHIFKVNNQCKHLPWSI